MKQLKQTINEIRALSPELLDKFTPLLWKYICYSPKMPLRLAQEHLLAQAETSILKVNDEYFTNKELLFNTFHWGDGAKKIFLTHGWGSKAADFSELITALSAMNDIQIIAFDAPGSGSSEGDLSNLLLFKQAVQATALIYGPPDIVIGHSLGAMANVIALSEMQILPSLLISIAPLLRLKENFEASMNAVNVPLAAQTAFLDDFNKKFGVTASYFFFDKWYNFDIQMPHWIFFDSEDLISPYRYLQEFLGHHPFIRSKDYKGIGHDKIIRSPVVISNLIEVISSILELPNIS